MELATLFVVACIQVSFSQLAFAHNHPDLPSKFNCWCNCGEDVTPPERRKEECTFPPEIVVPELIEEVVEEEVKIEEPVTEETVESSEGSTVRPTASYDANQGVFLRKLSKPKGCVCKHRRTCVCCTCCEEYVEEHPDCDVEYLDHYDDCGEEKHPPHHSAEDCVKERIRYRLRPLIYLGYGFDYLLHPPMAYRHFRPCCHSKTRHQ